MRGQMQTAPRTQGAPVKVSAMDLLPALDLASARPRRAGRSMGLSLQPPTGLEYPSVQKAKVSHIHEYSVGEKAMALRSDGSWSPCTIAEISEDKLKIILKSGFKQIRRSVVHIALKKIEAKPRLASFKEEDEEEEEEESSQVECQEEKTEPSEAPAQIIKPSQNSEASQMAVVEVETIGVSHDDMITGPAQIIKQSKNWSEASQMAMLQAENARLSHENMLLHRQSQMYYPCNQQDSYGYMCNPWEAPQAACLWYGDSTITQSWIEPEINDEKISKPGATDSWGSVSTDASSTSCTGSDSD